MMALPSGLMATLSTGSVCPSNVLSTSPVARSHMLVRVGRFRSKEGKNHVGWFQRDIGHHYKAGCSQHEATHRTVLSLEPDTRVFPSGLMATVLT